ncbi:unnamed protein product [Prorocentrum cordatum]|uniref:Uncharacterized protein n=2 Tax=Prorocentrum cordatum TaxID=2364126 RepID=A0ABN9Q5N0_9DINO|nr:unnamed protein product [Polarella glacialis]
MARRGSAPPLATALLVLLLIGSAEGRRVAEAIESHRLEVASGSSLAGRGAQSGAVALAAGAGRGAQSGAVALAAGAGGDPIFFATAVGLSTLANVANVALHAVRISRLQGTHAELRTVQEQIFDERADACFSVRSLEVQSDLLTRAIEAFVEFTGARVPETACPLSISGGKVGCVSTLNATAAKVIASDAARLSKSLVVVNSHLRRAMGAAVQSACHSAASGEIILQVNVDKLSEQIKQAQADLMSASVCFMTGLTFTVLETMQHAGSEHAGVKIDFEGLEDKIERGDVLIHSLMGLAQLSVGKTKIPEGISKETWNTMMVGLGIMWKAATAIALAVQNVAVVGIIVELDYILQTLYFLITDEHPEGLKVAVEVLELVNSVLRLVNDCLSLASPDGKGSHALHQVTLAVETLAAILRLAKTSLQLQLEQGQQPKLIAQAQAGKSEAALLRSYGTCNALGTAWTLSGIAGSFIKEVGVAGGVSLRDLDESLLSKVYERYVEERPSLAAKVLREALSLGTAAVTEELLQRAEALAKLAPITDFAVASDEQQLKALGALGFQPVSTVSRKARFLVCRGCGDSVITGMKVVVDDDMFQDLERNFSSAPEHFGDLRMPSGSTLNFVQLPREEGFSMLAFAKVPRAALADGAMPVLFDMREEVFATEARKMEDGAPDIFREKAMAIMKSNEVEVLSWKTDQTHVDALEDMFLNGGRCDAHPVKLDFGYLDVLAGRFLLASPGVLGEKSPLRNLVPRGLFQPGRFLTVTRGCGCRMGRLGNPYRSGASDSLAKWWMAIEDGKHSKHMHQVQRCQWRYDIWISEEPLVDVGAANADDDADLGCAISYASRSLPEPVDDLTQLVLVTGYDQPSRIMWDWEISDEYGVGPLFRGSRLLYSSPEARVGPAGRPLAIDDDGCGFDFLFQVWRRPPAEPQPSSREADDSHLAGQDMVMAFRANLGSVLCSAKCAFRDLEDVPEALGRVLGVSRPAAPLPRFVPHKRGAAGFKGCDHVQKMLLPKGFPTDLASFGQNGLGQLTTNDEVARGGLLGKIELIYREECDFEATLLLHPAPCSEGYMPDLRLNSSGIVEEICLPWAVGGTKLTPLHRYAVTWDLFHHDRDSLRDEEKEVEGGLIEAGFSRWGDTMMLETPELNTDIWFWRRSLRQRIFVQRDPRVTTAPGLEVCGERPSRPAPAAPPDPR